MLSREEQDKLHQAQDEFHRAQEALGRLTEENKKLTMKADVQEKFVQEIEKTFTEFKLKQEELLRGKDVVIQALQHQQVKIQEQANEAMRSFGKLEELRQENRQMVEDAQRKENDFYKLREQFEALQRESVRQNQEHLRSIATLKNELGQVRGAARQEQDGEMAQLKESMNRLRVEKEEIEAARNQIQDDFNRLRQLNQFLADKERLLQYELAKHRACAIGLEKICEDFKVRIDLFERAGGRVESSS